MMKSIRQTGLVAAMTAAAATLLLGGCDKESANTVDNTPVKARITSVIEGMTATRAEGTAWAANDRIGITAQKTAGGATLLANAPYITAAGDGVFAPQGDEFFFQDTDEVTFTAYYPFTESGKIAADGTVDGKTTDFENQSEFDFLFAGATGSSASPAVQFRFRHCMSRFVLKFLPGDGIASLSNITYSLKGMKFSGTFNTLTGEAKSDAAAAADLIMTDRTLIANNAAEVVDPLIFFPQQSDAEMTLSLTMGGTGYTATFRLPENKDNNNVRELASGYTYTYNVKVNNTGMTVSPANISDWTPGGSQNIDSHN